MPVLREAAARGTPLLGICIGMQVLFEESEEHGRHRGPGPPARPRAPLRRAAARARTWAGTGCSAARPHPLLDGFADGAHVYFVHSYFCDAPDDVVIATSDYGARLRGDRRARQRARACSSIPRRARPWACAMMANFVRACVAARRQSGGRRDRRSRHRHARGQGRAPQAGPRSRTRRSTAATRPRSRASGRRRARGGIHLVDLDAAIDGKPQPDAVGERDRRREDPGRGGRRPARARERACATATAAPTASSSAPPPSPDPGVVQEAVRLWPEAVAVALDARNGKVAVAGWKEVTTRGRAGARGRR